MDIRREPRKGHKKWLLLCGATAVAALTIAASSLKPAVPSVDAATIYTDTVRQGQMIVDVRGPGILVPEDTRWITAVTAGRIEKIHLLPGTTPVEPGTVILELSNPDVEIETLNADRQLSDAESQLMQLQATLTGSRLAQAAAVAELRSEWRDAQRRADAATELLAKGLIIPLDGKQEQDRAAALAERVQLEQERLDLLNQTLAQQIKAQEAQVARLRAIAAFQHGLKLSMVVRAGVKGLLRDVPLQIGQYALPGATLARIDPIPVRLKAVLRIAENQAKDLAIGQTASIDTRNGVAAGRVSRIDPAASAGTVTVDVSLDGPPPTGARSDLSVDGVIEIARLANVLHTGRPPYAEREATFSLFKLVERGSYAQRVSVRLGRVSAESVEIKQGLTPGEVVILSDMSRWDPVDRVRIK
jgi:multidrug resistance efflux pump